MTASERYKMQYWMAVGGPPQLPNPIIITKVYQSSQQLATISALIYYI